MNERLPAKYCQRRLTLVWLAGGGAILLLLFVQTLTKRYAGENQEVWEVLLPYIIPTLALMLGVLVANSMKETTETKERTSDRFLYRLAMGMSAFYLVCLLIIILTAVPGQKMTEHLKDVGLFVTALQGLNALVLGAFFVKG